MSNSIVPPQRARMIREIELRLGGAMIEVELTPDHYNLAIDIAVQKYRQRAVNAVEESFIFLETQPDVALYTLPSEVQEVRAIYRASLGGGQMGNSGYGVTDGPSNTIGNGGGSIDPFSLAFGQNMYSAMSPNGGMGMPGGGGGYLATYDFGMQQMKTMGMMFGRDLMFTWNTSTKKLLLQRKISHNEEVALHCYNAKPEEVMLDDVYARPWLLSYAVSQSKLMLGEARALYGSLAGPGGGVTLNGDSIKSEAQTEIALLDQELKDGVGQNQGYGIVIG